MPEMNLYRVLTERFGPKELPDLVADLNIEWFDLSGDTAKAKARDLVEMVRRNNATDKLLGVIASYGKSDLDLQPYIYLIILERYRMATEMEKLRTSLKLSPISLVGYNNNQDFRNTTVLNLQKEMEDSQRLGELLRIMKEQNPDLNLDAYEEILKAPSPNLIANWPRNPTDNSTDSTRTVIAVGSELVYENFDLRVGNKLADGRYPIEVTNSPQGEMKQPVYQTFPLDDLDFQDLVGYLRDLHARAADAVELGQKMRQLLFPESVWNYFVGSRAATKQQGKGLRIRLRIDPPELSSLPWEYCWDEEWKFFGLRRETPMIRYVAQNFAAEKLAAPNPIRVLVVIAAPKDLPALNVEEEKQRIEQTLAWLGDRVQLTVLPHATPEKLQGALAQKPHIFHFIGHGQIQKGGMGALMLENMFGQSQAIDAEQLLFLLANQGIKVVILNACKSAAHDARNAILGVAPALVQAEIPAVMAMQFNVPDQTALGFTRDLYRFLMAGYPLDTAVTEMRIGAFINASDKYYWGIPVLYMRSPDGVIWQKDESVMALFAQAMSQLADPPKPTAQDVAKQLTAVRQTLESLKGELDAGDADDALSDLTDALALANEAAPNAKRLRRKIDGVIEVLNDSGSAKAKGEVVPALQKVMELATTLFPE